MNRTPRAFALSLSSAVVALALCGCPLLQKTQSDAGDGGEDAATATATKVGAKNEANVLRYAHETPLPNEAAVIGASGAVVRNFPGNGPEVASLPKGAAVTKVSQYFATGTLIVFDSPQKDGSKLMGWVDPSVFGVATVTPTPTKAVVPPAVVKVVDAGAPAPLKDAGGPAPTPPGPVDAGKPAVVVDAGGGASAGGAIPQPAKGTVAVPPTGGKCPDGWGLTEAMCRRKCTADAECPRGTKCLVKASQKVCTSG